MLPRHLIVTALLIALVALPLQPPSANGCAALWSKGNGVLIAEEGAIIIWDAAQKMQHFIRWARFDTTAPDFGFLVPTPTQPELAEVTEGIFSTMEQWIAPKVITRTDWSIEPLLCMLSCAKLASRLDDAKAPANVRVLHSQKVGGFDAVVLEADDAEKLRQWLDKNGYIARPELTSWLGPYLAEKWKITAFKIAHDPKTGAGMKTSPVRMSFRTDRPFFPYREPEESKEKDAPHRGMRLLRVFFVGDQRVQASLGNAMWPARVPWSNTLGEPQRAELAKAVGLETTALPASARLTVFEDASSPRAGKEEVYFEPSTDQSIVEPPPREMIGATVWIPIDVVLVGVVLVGVLCFSFRKRRPAALR
jgi:Uncharacterized protein conserved in bacteria (DUF2330)